MKYRTRRSRLAETRAGKLFSDFLRRFHHIHTIVVNVHRFLHYMHDMNLGAPVPILVSIFSCQIQTLRNIYIHGLLSSAREPPPTPLEEVALLPITTFKYDMGLFGPCPCSSASETVLLATGMRSWSQSLHVPIENAPIARILASDWPCLRELVLYGGHESAQVFPLDVLFGRMPALRILRLLFAYREDIPPASLSISPSTGLIPLTELSVSHPDPNANMWSLLPQCPTLSMLASKHLAVPSRDRSWKISP
ncbi:hypothetical protein C8Q72DRAFT_634972 [Fomitopsis betulina]|nr:hypothetical protein C8Q72DRAFT_634972 [Fomitopsis betulina]